MWKLVCPHSVASSESGCRRGWMDNCLVAHIFVTNRQFVMAGGIDEWQSKRSIDDVDLPQKVIAKKRLNKGQRRRPEDVRNTACEPCNKCSKCTRAQKQMWHKLVTPWTGRGRVWWAGTLGYSHFTSSCVPADLMASPCVRVCGCGCRVCMCLVCATLYPVLHLIQLKPGVPHARAQHILIYMHVFEYRVFSGRSTCS